MICKKRILLYDGVCNLCNRLIHFIIKRENGTKLIFLPLQLQEGQSLLDKFLFPVDDPDSVIYIKGDSHCI
jgi:predicted DCC family thiol-disulfide oxidoreductase YuxK